MKTRLSIYNLVSIVTLSALLIVGALWPTAHPAAQAGPACNQSVAITGASAATVELVAATTGQRVRVCGLSITGAGATNVTLKYGTGTTCGTGTASLTGAIPLAANTSVTAGFAGLPIFLPPVSNAVCWTNSAAVQVSGFLSYGQF